MISLEELLDGADFKELPDNIQFNLETLLNRINIIRQSWGRPMTVTSGLRTLKHHLEIYAAKGITDKSKIPMKSKHLVGAAVDISDPKKLLQTWCLQNVDKLETAKLWCESFSGTPNWVHFQIFPPNSGKRFFNP
jgi:hypothetical protein